MKYKIGQKVIVMSIKDTIFTPLLVGVAVIIEDRNEEKGSYVVSIPSAKNVAITLPETHLIPASYGD